MIYHAEEVHSKLSTMLPTLYKDDIIPGHLIKQLITLAGTLEQAELLIEWMEPKLLSSSSDGTERFMQALDSYDSNDEISVEQSFFVTFA